jgi:hypothetical protein
MGRPIGGRGSFAILGLSRLQSFWVANRHHSINFRRLRSAMSASVMICSAVSRAREVAGVVQLTKGLSCLFLLYFRTSRYGTSLSISH